MIITGCTNTYVHIYLFILFLNRDYFIYFDFNFKLREGGWDTRA